MTIATHQPIFLPWPGLFFKALKADCMVLLDAVQFPRGRSWMSRNRLKNSQGELWLTVPIHKKGKGLQVIQRVEIFDKINWRRRHLQSIQQNYVHAPYFEQYFSLLESIYRQDHSTLISLNLQLIRFFWDSLVLKPKLVLQSELGVTAKGTDLLISICEHMEASRYVAFPPAEKYIDRKKMEKRGIKVSYITFHPPVYPQLWGNFIYNLSILDLLLNCGPKSSEIIEKA
jgi:hypothetical protein